MSFRDLQLLALAVAGMAVFGVVDGSMWRGPSTPTIAYRPAFLFGLILLFGWRALVWCQIVLLALFLYFFGWRGAIFVEPQYLVSYACAFVVAKRLAGPESWLSRERSTLAFLAGALLAPAIPAFTIEPVLRALGIPPPEAPPVVESWLRQSAAILALAPVVLVYGSDWLKERGAWPGERERRQRMSGRDVVELVLEMVVWAGALLMTVHFKARYGLNITYLTFFPPLVFTLFRGMRGATIALAANAIIATTLWVQLHWADSLSAGDLRLLIAVYSATILVLAAVVDERQRARRHAARR